MVTSSPLLKTTQENRGARCGQTAAPLSMCEVPPTRIALCVRVRRFRRIRPEIVRPRVGRALAGPRTGGRRGRNFAEWCGGRVGIRIDAESMFGSRRRRRAPFTAVWPTRVDGGDDAGWEGEAGGGGGLLIQTESGRPTRRGSMDTLGWRSRLRGKIGNSGRVLNRAAGSEGVGGRTWLSRFALTMVVSEFSLPYSGPLCSNCKQWND